MKKTVLTILALICIIGANSQSLVNLYKQGNVSLIEDPDFGTQNNWSKIFYDYTADKNQGKDGKNKSIVVASDGRIFMSHRSRHSISIFDKNGNYIKEFGKKGSRESDFIYMPVVVGILDQKYLATAAVDGRILFFDLNGQWIKTFSLDYMPLDYTTLGQKKLAILGHTSWKTKIRTFIAIKDYDSGKETIIWENFREIENKKTINVTHSAGGVTTMSLPFTHPSYTNPKLICTPNGDLALIFPEKGEIKVFSPSGKLLKSYSVEVGEPLKLTEKERTGYYNKFMEYIKTLEKESETANDSRRKQLEETISQLKQQAHKYLDPDFYPEKLPEISQALFDTDGNLLVFVFTKEKGDNKFIAYTFDNSGSKICQSSFESTEYDLNFSKSKFVFHNGKIIGLQTLKKENTDVPVRLVRFNLSN